MKKSISVIFLLFTIFSIEFVSCRKGEDDPALSLRSRKARMAGEWKMTSGKTVSTNVYTSSSTTSTTTTTYDGANATESNVTTTPFGTFNTDDAYAYTDAITFEKNGKFSGANVNNGITTTFEGTWNFEGGVADVKKKTQLILFYTKIVEDGATTTIEGNSFQIKYEIKELRNKKLVLTNTNKTTYSNGDSYEDISETTFEQ